MNLGPNPGSQLVNPGSDLSLSQKIIVATEIFENIAHDWREEIADDNVPDRYQDDDQDDFIIIFDDGELATRRKGQHERDILMENL